jgi:tetratricopeptide (TPR) repeat protein
MVGGNAADTAFCDGLARTMTRKLTMLEHFNKGFAVLPEGEIQALDDVSPSEVRRVLGADLVLTGTLARSADDMTLRPVRIDFDVGPAGDYDADAFLERRGALLTDPIANLSTWQDSVVVDLTSLLGLELGPEERKVLFAHGTSVPEAYMRYQEGMGHLYPYRGTRDIDAAVAAFGRAIAMDSSYVLAHAGLGNAYYLKGYYSGDASLHESAVAACGRALDKDSTYAYAHVIAGYAHYYADQLDKALGRFRQALGVDTLCFSAYLGMGSVLTGLGDFGGAEEAYSRAARLRPHVPVVYERLTYLHLTYQGKHLAAVESASKTIELKPNTYRGYSELGAAYYSLGRMDQAAEAFEQSIGIDSTAYACANLGTIYFGQKRYADAARMYKAALGLGTSNYRVLGFLAEAYFWSPGQRDLAIETFGQAIELLDRDGVLDHTDATQLSDLASYYARVGRSARSESLLVKAALLEPSEALILFRIADTYEQLGKRGVALEWLEKALEKGAPLETMDDFPGLRELKTDTRYRQLLEARGRQS